LVSTNFEFLAYYLNLSFFWLFFFFYFSDVGVFVVVLMCLSLLTPCPWRFMKWAIAAKTGEIMSLLLSLHPFTFSQKLNFSSKSFISTKYNLLKWNYYCIFNGWKFN